ncbi:flagellar hook-basal body complex protein FliE [bacterium]|nr:flagellar hook-basal body complex protein FliE [bacterium]
MEINPINVQNQMWTIQIGGLGRIGEDKAVNPAAEIAPVTDPSQPKFESLFAQELDKVNAQMLDADKTVADIAAGKSENIHGALIDLQKANLSFKMLVEVRNKALDAYQELMRMQA